MWFLLGVVFGVYGVGKTYLTFFFKGGSGGEGK